MGEDTAARIVAGLAAEAEFIDGGGFSIDPEAARRKLGDRQLAEPDAWILLVIEAAELAGVERIEVRERALGLVISMHGPAAPQLAPAAELEELFTWVFVALEALPTAERARARARQLLALGVNAALARPVRSVSLACVEPEAGRRMVLHPEDPGVIGAIEGGAPQLELRFEAALDVGDQLYARSELALVAERCGWGRAAIEVLGRAVAPRPEPLSVRAARTLEPQLGRAELLTTPVAASLTLVGHGVALETLALPGWAAGFRAVLYRGYERDLSQGKAVRSPAFEAVMNQLRRLHDEMVAELHGKGEAVSFAGGVAQRTVPREQRTLAAMVNQADNTLGHSSAWAALGCLMMWGYAALNGYVLVAAALGVLALGAGAAAGYFLRMRKVFGDEG